MKTSTADTLVIVMKGFAFVVIGVFTPWTGALSQWINSGTWPEKIIWVGVVLPMSMIGGASALVAFTSGSWQTYQQQRKANESGQDQVTTVTPTTTAENQPPKTP